MGYNNITAGSGITLTQNAGYIQIAANGGSGVTSLTGTANQIAVSASTGAVTVSLTNTVIVPSALGVNVGSINASATNQIAGTKGINLYLTGTQTGVDGSTNQSAINLSPTFTPASLSGISASIYINPTYALPTLSNNVLIGCGIYVGQGAQTGVGAVTNGYNLYLEQPQFGSTGYSLGVFGGIVLAGTTVSSNTTLFSYSCFVKVNTGGGAVTITLPPSVPGGSTGFWFAIIKDSGNALVNNITISGNGHNIDGSSTATINLNYGTVRIFGDGSQYWTW